MKNAVVTGASGFIGLWLVRELLSRNVEVYAIVRRNSASRNNLLANAGLHVIECNLDEYSLLADIINVPSIDVFYHLAWEGSAGNPRGEYSIQLNNVKYTIEAVKAAKKMNCLRFCGAGSIMEQEADYFIPHSGVKPDISYIYSTAKLTAHYMAKAMAASIGISFVWGIISNAYGVGEISPRFLNSTIGKFLSNQGGDFTEGRQFYDFVYVSDVALAFYLLGESGEPYTAYYIGSGEPRQLREYIEIIRNCINPEIQLNFGEVPFNGVYLPIETFDTSKLMKDTGYRTSVEFSAGIKATADWIKTVRGKDYDTKL